MDGKSFMVDWQRRRVLPLTGALSCCVHGSRLIEFCPDCGLDLDALAADMTPREAA